MYSVALGFKYSRFIFNLFFLPFSSFQLLTHPLVHSFSGRFALSIRACLSLPSCLYVPLPLRANLACIGNLLAFCKNCTARTPPPSIYFSTDVALSLSAGSLPVAVGLQCFTPHPLLLSPPILSGRAPGQEKKRKKFLPYPFFPIPVIPLPPTPPGLQLRPLWEGRIRSQPPRWRRLPALHAIPPLHLCLFSCLDFLPFRYNADGPPHIGFTA